MLYVSSEVVSFSFLSNYSTSRSVVDMDLSFSEWYGRGIFLGGKNSGWSSTSSSDWACISFLDGKWQNSIVMADECQFLFGIGILKCKNVGRWKLEIVHQEHQESWRTHNLIPKSHQRGSRNNEVSTQFRDAKIVGMIAPHLKIQIHISGVVVSTSLYRRASC